MAEKEKFIEAVLAMRKAQKDYFYYRRSSDLEKSKRLEKKVDEMLAIWQGAPRQASMF